MTSSSSSSSSDDDVEETGSGSGSRRESLHSRDDIVGEVGREKRSAAGFSETEGSSGGDGRDLRRFWSEGSDGVLAKGKRNGKLLRGRSDGRELARGLTGKKRRRNVRDVEDEIEEDDFEGQVKKRHAQSGHNRALDGAALEHDEDEANADLSLRIVAKAEQLQSRRAQVGPTLGAYRKAKNRERGKIVSAPDAKGLVENVQFMAADNSGKNTAVERLRIVHQSKSRSETPEDGELQDDVNGNVVLALETMGEVGGEDSSNGPEDGELLEEVNVTRLQAVDPGTSIADDSSNGKSKKKKKKKKKKMKEETRGDVASDRHRDGEEELADGDKSKVVENSNQAGEIDGRTEQSLVMRRLLRGPRYFDPPEDLELSCFSCGRTGHIAVACPDGPRMKPCYVCGSFGHDGRACPQKTECYVCGTVGHIAKNCPNKGSGKSASRDGNRVCLKCARSGHEASNCYYSYDEEDLAQVQCYVCNEFGHLCCVTVVDTSPVPVSCYSCGETGHTGVGCARPRRNDRDVFDKGPASVCYKCGEEGHFARGCSKPGPSWPSPWSEEKNQGRYQENHRYKPYSASRLPRWMDLEKREPIWSRVDVGDRWMGARSRLSLDSFRVADSHTAFESDKYVDDYMGPIEDFSSPPYNSHRKRLKRNWTSTRTR